MAHATADTTRVLRALEQGVDAPAEDLRDIERCSQSFLWEHGEERDPERCSTEIGDHVLPPILERSGRGTLPLENLVVARAPRQFEDALLLEGVERADSEMRGTWSLVGEGAGSHQRRARPLVDECA